MGRKLGLARRLSCLWFDPEDFELHHVVPTTTSFGRLLDDPRELDPRAGGAGFRLEDAINRAMGELLERYASLAFEGKRKIVSYYSAVHDSGNRVVPFEMLSLFSREQLLTQDFPYSSFTERTPVGWLEGTDLLSNSAINVPDQLVRLGYIPSPDEATCFYSTSSGCAIAPSIEGAVLAGLLECFERDAIMIRWYARLPPPVINLHLEDVAGKPMGAQVEKLETRFHDLTLDGDVPVVGVTCVERTGRSCFFLLGAGSAVDTFTAARKALIEAAQGRPFIKFLANVGGPPQPGSVFNNFDSNCRFFAEPSNAPYAEWFLQNTAVSERDCSAVNAGKDPAELLDVLLDRCSAMGITPIAFDLTTPELSDHGLFACRVFVPELVPLCVPSAPFFGHPRLARFIAAARQDPSAVCVPGWVPHPFP